MMKGKIIVIEGVDGVGKETQTELLYKYLLEKGEKVVKFSYPNYKSDSSTLVKKYLNGDFGKNAKDINPYMASSFYAVDRFASYMEEWKKFYDEGFTILMDRYVTSNLLFQSSKLKTNDEKIRFIKWNEEFEYDLGSLPRPDKVFYLTVEDSVVKEVQDKREHLKNGMDHDIHEAELNFLYHVKDNGLFVGTYLGWNIVNCTLNGERLSKEEVSNMIQACL